MGTVAVPAHLSLDRTLWRFVSGLVAVQAQLTLEVRIPHRGSAEPERSKDFAGGLLGGRVHVISRLMERGVAPLVNLRGQDGRRAAALTKMPRNSETDVRLSAVHDLSHSRYSPDIRSAVLGGSNHCHCQSVLVDNDGALAQPARPLEAAAQNGPHASLADTGPHTDARTVQRR